MNPIALLSSPSVAVVIFMIFLILYFVFLDLEGGFGYTFLHFGPGTDRDNTTSFMGIKLDSWRKVIILYVVSFFSALMTTYYHSTYTHIVSNKVLSSTVDAIPYGKIETYAIMLLDPIIIESLAIIEFFTTLTLQFQFILPALVGRYCAQLPYIISILSNRTFLY